jgi:transcriptional regulator with AAA-type ATPase domain
MSARWVEEGVRATTVRQIAFEGAGLVQGVPHQRASSPRVPLPASDEAPGEAFLGRDLELKTLGELLERAISGSGRLVFVTGEPGIGKTALAEEFLRRARADHPELILATARCLEQYGTGEAYLPFLGALADLFSGQGRD